MRILYDAARKVQVGVDAISGRLTPREGAEQREISELREEIKRLRTERDTLRKVVTTKENIPFTAAGIKDPRLTVNRHTATATDTETEENMTENEFVRPYTISELEEAKKKHPARRPPLQGKSKVLEDTPLTTTPMAAPTHSAPRIKKTREEHQKIPFSIEKMESSFVQFMEAMNNKVRDMFTNFLQGIGHERMGRGQEGGSSSRFKSDAPATRGSVTSDRPAPAQGRGKKENKKGNTQRGESQRT